MAAKNRDYPQSATDTDGREVSHHAVWLRGNWRLTMLAAILLLPGLGLIVWAAISNVFSVPVRMVIIATAMIDMVLGLIFAWIGSRSVIRRMDDELVIHVGLQQVRLPISIVEVFFGGHEELPMANHGGSVPETANIIMRVAESAKEWQRVDIPRWIGRWCDGYLTIRGLWCEPVTRPLLESLNDQLRRAKLELRGTRQTSASDSFADKLGLP